MILVHHLRVGRSIFAVWLLEELGLEYDLKIYNRDENNRAPASLKDAHPLGKSPVIETEGMTLAESGAITSYLIDKYDTDNTLAPPRSDEQARAMWTQWLHYSEASAFMPLLMKLLMSRDPDNKPPLLNGFIEGEVKLHMDYMDASLGEKTFLMGDELQAPDFGFTFVLMMAGQAGLLSDRPNLAAYLARNMARPAFKRAAERTGG